MACSGCGKRKLPLYTVVGYTREGQQRYKARVAATSTPEAVEKARNIHGKIIGGYYIVTDSKGHSEKLPEVAIK